MNSPYSYGYADPLAPCHPVTGFPWEACTCADTVKGDQYWVWDVRVGLCDLAVVTLSKRETCDVIWENGACCDGYTFGVDVRNADGLIVVSDMSTGLWTFRMEGFQGWNGEDWGMPDVSSAQKWDVPLRRPIS